MALEVMARNAAPIPLDVRFRVEPGELLALVGHSGSGKTSLLRAIAGLWRPDTGRVTVDGQVWLDTDARVNLPPHRRHVGMVFQSYALFPHMSAAQNIQAAMAGACAEERRAEAGRLLDLVNLSGLGGRRPAQLSGGQQQRVALARALARRPRALLLDEPFSAVDRATRERLHAEIVALRAHLNMPVVLVTHDMNEAQILADRIAVLSKGVIVREGSTPELMSDPVALRAMGLREVAAMLSARVAGQEADGLTRLDTAGGAILLPRIEAERGVPIRVRILAHEVILARARPEGLSAQNILAGRVRRIVPGEGPGVMVYLAIGDEEIVSRITRRAAESLALAPGDEVFAILKSMSVARDHVGRAPSARSEM
ncbi:molybdate transport system ATP-binding protein [Salinihabitans flavidus]|uniref:Molybdate transport system ATP-binding protein n=1 Tax=Salinihabitans flavidus TaxID=569882 RepID=A0A1H8RDI5_9RHOB|nr:molybdenum ABC transporter ATP-binding protein [Salinihabitans flavidus]SEO64228.1 molybdate transport system ATP-binding protein [Salinihabitans flavidus]